MSPRSPFPRSVADLLRAICQPARLEILLALGAGEACVCHLEALLGMRQAYLSQHLMALRQADLVLDRKEGRFIYYRLKDGRLLELIELAARLAGYTLPATLPTALQQVVRDCPCPHCSTAEELIEIEETRQTDARAGGPVSAAHRPGTGGSQPGQDSRMDPTQ